MEVHQVNELTEEVIRSRRLPPPALAKAILREVGASHQQVADVLEVRRETVTRWLNGTRKPRGRNRLAFAELLDELQREVLGS
jgi:DNA-binding transcriptional regulator YiaG